MTVLPTIFRDNYIDNYWLNYNSRDTRSNTLYFLEAVAQFLNTYNTVCMCLCLQMDSKYKRTHLPFDQSQGTRPWRVVRRNRCVLLLIFTIFPLRPYLCKSTDDERRILLQGTNSEYPRSILSDSRTSFVIPDNSGCCATSYYSDLESCTGYSRVIQKSLVKLQFLWRLREHTGQTCNL